MTPRIKKTTPRQVAILLVAAYSRKKDDKDNKLTRVSFSTPTWVKVTGQHLFDLPFFNRTAREMLSFGFVMAPTKNGGIIIQLEQAENWPKLTSKWIETELDRTDDPSTFQRLMEEMYPDESDDTEEDDADSTDSNDW